MTDVPSSFGIKRRILAAAAHSTVSSVLPTVSSFPGCIQGREDYSKPVLSNPLCLARLIRRGDFVELSWPSGR